MAFTAFKHKNYRYFFIGIIFSNIGTWTNRIAQDWLTLDLTGSAKSLGLIVAAQFFPGIIFAAYAGVIADRYNQKPILLWCNFAGILIATTTGILIFNNFLTFEILFFPHFYLELSQQLMAQFAKVITSSWSVTKICLMHLDGIKST